MAQALFEYFSHFQNLPGAPRKSEERLVEHLPAASRPLSRLCSSRPPSSPAYRHPSRRFPSEFQPLDRRIFGELRSRSRREFEQLAWRKGSTPEQAIAVLVEVWGAIREDALLSKGGAGYCCAIRQPVPGCDEPPDGASDEGEMQAFREEMGELVYDIEH
jgi:hypothetical protein